MASGHQTPIITEGDRTLLGKGWLDMQAAVQRKQAGDRVILKQEDRCSIWRQTTPANLHASVRRHLSKRCAFKAEAGRCSIH